MSSDILVIITGYKPVRQFSLCTETVRHIWLPPMTVRDLLLLAKTVSVIILPAESLCKSKRSRTIPTETKYDGQSRQEAKIGGLVYTLGLLPKIIALRSLAVLFGLWSIYRHKTRACVCMQSFAIRINYVPAPRFAQSAFACNLRNILSLPVNYR